MAPRKFKIAYDDPRDQFERVWLNEEYDYAGLFNYIITAMQFSYDYVYDPVHSEVLPNGTSTGMIGLLNRSEADFAPGQFFLTAERWDAVAFNYPYKIDDIPFVTKKPTYHPEMKAIFQTLSASVWLSLLVSVIIVTIIFFVVLKYRCTLEDVIMHVIAIGLNQEGNIIPKKAGEVLLIFTWMLAMMLFSNCFKSVLLSFLSFPPLTGVRTVPELADAIRAGKYRATASKRSSLAPFLQESSNEDIRVIGESVFNTPPVEIDDLFNKSFSFSNLGRAGPRSTTHHLGEKFYFSKDSMGFYMKATAVSKDFCCKDEMDMIILRFLAAGIDLKINRFLDFQDKVYLFPNIPDDDLLRKITLTDISGAFMFLFAGYCLSIFVLIIEIRIKNREMHLFSTV